VMFIASTSTVTPVDGATPDLTVFPGEEKFYPWLVGSGIYVYGTSGVTHTAAPFTVKLVP
jgi:hypothetical protein